MNVHVHALLLFLITVHNSTNDILWHFEIHVVTVELIFLQVVFFTLCMNDILTMTIWFTFLFDSQSFCHHWNWMCQNMVKCNSIRLAINKNLAWLKLLQFCFVFLFGGVSLCLYCLMSVTEPSTACYGLLCPWNLCSRTIQSPCFTLTDVNRVKSTVFCSQPSRWKEKKTQVTKLACGLSKRKIMLFYLTALHWGHENWPPTYLFKL